MKKLLAVAVALAILAGTAHATVVEFGSMTYTNSANGYVPIKLNGVVTSHGVYAAAVRFRSVAQDTAHPMTISVTSTLSLPVILESKPDRITFLVYAFGTCPTSDGEFARAIVSGGAQEPRRLLHAHRWEAGEQESCDSMTAQPPTPPVTPEPTPQDETNSLIQTLEDLLYVRDAKPAQDWMAATVRVREAIARARHAGEVAERERWTGAWSETVARFQISAAISDYMVAAIRSLAPAEKEPTE